MNYTAAFVILLAANGTVLAANSPETELSLVKPARVPGATLKAGHYTIRILDRLSDRYILEIHGNKRSAPLTTFLAVPDATIPRSSNGTPIYWAKSGRTPAVRGMWISGAPTAAVFVFPKADAAKLAQSVGQPVPAVDPDSEGKKEVGKMDDSDRQIVTLWLLSAVAITPEGKKTGIQAAKFVPSSQESAAMANTIAKAEVPNSPQAPAPPAKLPKTATTSADNVLVGLLLVLTGTVVAKSYGSSRSARHS